jgi:acyl-CoA synthetase (NDP forming)
VRPAQPLCADPAADTDPAIRLRTLLAPRTVAVIGASEANISRNFVQRLVAHGFPGRLYPVNPRRGSVAGVPCVRSLGDIPEPIDLAFVAVSGPAVVAAVEEAATRGAKLAVVWAAGFGERDADGAAHEARLREAAARCGVRLLGPNCFGFANVVGSVVLFGSARLEPLVAGPVGLILQSGGLGTIFNRAQERGIGCSYLVSTGNETDLEVADFVEMCAMDEHTRAVGVFVEGFKDGERFLGACRKAAEADCPVVILKGGASSKGGRAAALHTGKLAGPRGYYAHALRQVGAVEVYDLDELLETTSFLAKGRRSGVGGVGVVGMSGGGSVLAADAAEAVGLALPDPSPDSVAGLAGLLRFTTVTNPLDLSYPAHGSLAEAYVEALRLFAADPVFDALVTIITPTPEAFGERAAAVVRATAATAKPVAAIYTGPLAVDGVGLLEAGGVTVFSGFRACFRGLRVLRDYWTRRGRLMASPRPPVAGSTERRAPALALLPGDGGFVDEHRGKQLLALYGIPVTREAMATSEEEAVAVARDLGPPVALKAVVPGLVHKTEAEAVHLALRSPDEVRTAFRALQRLTVRPAEGSATPVLVQEHVTGGVEVIVGWARDPDFGQFILCGSGGVLAELHGDVTARFLPVGDGDLEEMVDELACARLLRGYRGRPPGDIAALRDTLQRLAVMAVDLGDTIDALEINPLLVLPDATGVKAVDTATVLTATTRPGSDDRPG